MENDIRQPQFNIAEANRNNSSEFPAGKFDSNGAEDVEAVERFGLSDSQKNAERISTVNVESNVVSDDDKNVSVDSNHGELSVSAGYVITDDTLHGIVSKKRRGIGIDE